MRNSAGAQVISRNWTGQHQGPAHPSHDIAFGLSPATYNTQYSQRPGGGVGSAIQNRRFFRRGSLRRHTRDDECSARSFGRHLKDQKGEADLLQLSAGINVLRRGVLLEHTATAIPRCTDRRTRKHRSFSTSPLYGDRRIGVWVGCEWESSRWTCAVTFFHRRAGATKGDTEPGVQRWRVTFFLLIRSCGDEHAMYKNSPSALSDGGGGLAHWPGWPPRRRWTTGPAPVSSTALMAPLATQGAARPGREAKSGDTPMVRALPAGKAAAESALREVHASGFMRSGQRRRCTPMRPVASRSGLQSLC